MNDLRTYSLEKYYGKRKVADKIDINICKKEIVGLLGPNGAGKTTIFNMIVGLVKPNSGKIYIGTTDITQFPMYLRAQKGIGYLPQEPTIFNKLSVEENLMLILEFIEKDKNKRETILQNSLKEFGLENVRKQKGYNLSGGEKRRVEIARALLISPEFLLLDEPFVGIDPITVSELQNMIFILKNKDIGILITDHNVRDTLQVIDRAYIIYEGKILFEGNSKKLINNPEARKIYLGEKFKV